MSLTLGDTTIDDRRIVAVEMPYSEAQALDLTIFFDGGGQMKFRGERFMVMEIHGQLMQWLGGNPSDYQRRLPLAAPSIKRVGDPPPATIEPKGKS